MKSFIKKSLHHLPFFKTTNGLRDPSWLERIKTTSYHKWLIGIGTALLLTFLLSPTLQLPYKEYRVGDIAQKEIKSTQDLLVHVAGRAGLRLEVANAVRARRSRGGMQLEETVLVLKKAGR